MKALKKPLIGILLISTPRFHDLGKDTEHDFFYKRKELVAEDLFRHMDFADLIFPGVVYTRDDLTKAMQAFNEEQPDLIFASFLSWSDDFAWIRFLRDMAPIPIFFATIVQPKPSFDDSLTEDRFVDFLAAGGLVGSQEASGSIARFARPMFKKSIGPVDQVMKELKCFAKVCALRTELKHTNFGLLPSYNEVMWATYVDPYSLFMKLGPELRFLTVAELTDEIEMQPESEVNNMVAAILEKYPNDGTVKPDKMYASVAASLALEKLARRNRIEMMVLNDVSVTLLTKVGLRPGFTPCPGTDDVMVVPEGDIGGGIACYLLNKVSGSPVNFIEPFYINYADDTFTVGHAGPQDYTNPNSRTVISEDTRFAKTSYKHAGAPFTWNVIGEGEKTMVHVSQDGGSFKIAVAVVDALPCGHMLAGYSHGILRSRIPATEFFGKLLDFGVTQHYGLVDGNWSEEIAAFAELMGFACLRL